MAVRDPLESDRVKANTTAPTHTANSVPTTADQRITVPEISEYPFSHMNSEGDPVTSMRECCRRSPSFAVGVCGNRNHTVVDWVFMLSGLTPSTLAAVLRLMRLGTPYPRAWWGAWIAGSTVVPAP